MCELVSVSTSLCVYNLWDTCCQVLFSPTVKTTPLWTLLQYIYVHIFIPHLCFPPNMQVHLLFSTNFTHSPRIDLSSVLPLLSISSIFTSLFILSCTLPLSTFHLSLFSILSLHRSALLSVPPPSSFYPSPLISSYFSLHPFPYLSLYRDLPGCLSESLLSNLCTKCHFLENYGWTSLFVFRKSKQNNFWRQNALLELHQWCIRGTNAKDGDDCQSDPK